MSWLMNPHGGASGGLIAMHSIDCSQYQTPINCGEHENPVRTVTTSPLDDLLLTGIEVESRSRTVTRATCDVCDWTCETAAEMDRYDLSQAVIDHHVDTGHAPITSAGVTDPPDATERTDERDAIREAEKRRTLKGNGSAVVDG